MCGGGLGVLGHIYIYKYYCMYRYIYIYTSIVYTHIFGKIKLSINAHVCVDACMYVCMDIWVGKRQKNRVLKEICTQFGMLRSKIYVVVFLGEPNT